MSWDAEKDSFAAMRLICRRTTITTAVGRGYTLSPLPRLLHAVPTHKTHYIL